MPRPVLVQVRQLLLWLACRQDTHWIICQGRLQEGLSHSTERQQLKGSVVPSKH